MIKSIYLSGACKCLEDCGNDWRKAIKNEIERTTFYKCFNPNEYYNYKDAKPKTEKECMQYFLHRLRDSSLIIVNLDNSDKSVGTGMELILANELHKPIIGFNDNDTTYPWSKELCDVVLLDEDEVVDYIKNYY